ncbi:CHAT domain-containing protein [Streptomyces rochei]|uniref:CHAT domain-containing protein n=2 Tax=Streptomyces TaxID=1883 RepID=UPI000FAAC688|nr:MULTISPECIES: CHAT domain-containing protein [Streptomyces]MBU8552386.1 CHAT domain-containing protein [Streptomyces sp. Osf17]MBU8559173.1 CHAT domain-containing protein [Streptomyces sp. Babs14]MCC8450830.1 CHAT domain-containing protein [Streptomyces rochei]RSS07914.1 CHAT domain-containing protein [Streptomyces sp. WAC08401]RSS31690.1 CHAT domain-containing protein [Streptomyces sp. WAC08452]
MSGAQDLTIRLSWTDDRKAAAVVVDADDRPLHTPQPRALGPNTATAWDQPVPSVVAEMLGRVLFPPSVRRIVAERAPYLAGDGHLRLRLVLPGPGDEGPRPLGALRWESVRVPSATAPAVVWEDWAAEAGPLPDGGCELGRHPRFTLVREVRPVLPLPAMNRPGKGLVLVADATSVHGDVGTPHGVEPVPRSESWKRGDADRQLVTRALKGSWLSARTLPAPATAEEIRRQLAPGAGVFYFGGHQTTGGLVVGAEGGAEAAEWLDAGTVAGWLRTAGVRLAVLMACDSAGSADTPGSAVSAADRLVREGVPHVVAVQGKVSHSRAATFAGGFFDALARGCPVDVALREGASLLDGEGAVPVLYTQRRSTDLAVGLLPEAGRPVLSSTAHRLPVGDGGGRLPMTDERFRVHLDACWSLSETPVLDVLADPAAVDLPGLLDAAESTLHAARHARSLPHEGPRVWYACDAPAGRLPRTEGELRGAVRPRFWESPQGRGRGVGLVVRCPAATAFTMGDEFREDLARLHAFGWDLRGVVVQVHGPRADFVRHAAERVARVLLLGEYLVREQSRLGERADPPPVAMPSALAPLTGATGPGRAAGALLERVRAADGDQEPGPAPVADARAVVEQLNAEDAWGDPADETTVLRAVGLWWPALYRQLLAAYAALRTGPARAWSLRLAAARDADLEHWLRRAGDAVPDPADLPLLDGLAELADSVVLALLRAGLRNTDAFAQWREEDLSAAVLAAVAVAERGRVAGADLERPDTAVALDRAGLVGPADLPLLDPEGRYPGSWALVTRHPLDERAAAWLYGLDPVLRRLAGLSPAPEAYDLELEEQVSERRRALRPPLPGH